MAKISRIVYFLTFSTSFINSVPLTKNASLFRSAISQSRVSDGGDLPESQLDAMYQVADCTAQIGWRNNSHHILLLMTDAKYHKAGDARVIC